MKLTMPPEFFVLAANFAPGASGESALDYLAHGPAHHALRTGIGLRLLQEMANQNRPGGIAPSPNPRAREQMLIDTMFEVLMKARAGEIKGTREEAAEWLAGQLRSLGFDTVPMGMSWAVLK